MKTENDSIRHELEQMMELAKTSYTDLEEARARIDELEADQESGPEDWAEQKEVLETALTTAQQELETYKKTQEQAISGLQGELSSAREEVDALNAVLSETHTELDSWKTKFGDIQTEFELAQANWSEREEELAAIQAESSTTGSGVNGDTLIAELKATLEEKEKLLSQMQEDHAAAIQSWKEKHLALHYEYERYSEESELDRQKDSNLLWESEKAVEDLKAQLQSKDEDVERLNSLLEEVANRSVMPDNESLELRAALEESKTECERLASLLQDETEQVSALQQSTSELDSVIQALSEEKTKLMEDFTAMETTLLEKEKECERLAQSTSSTHVLQRERDQSMLVSADLRVPNRLLFPTIQLTIYQEQIKNLQQRIESTMVAESNMQSEAKRVEEALQSQLQAARLEVASLSDQLTKAQQDTANQV